MTKKEYDNYCESEPAFGEAFSLTRKGLYFKGSNSRFGGYRTYRGGVPLVDAVIDNLKRRGAKEGCRGTDSMLNQLSYELIYAHADACLRISGGNTFCGGKGAWLTGDDAGNVALLALEAVSGKKHDGGER